MQKDTDPKYEPLILGIDGKDLDFVWPVSEAYQDGRLYIEDGNQLLLSCPGKKNTQKTSGKQSATATCSKGNLLVEGKKVSTTTTSCSKIYAESTLQVTDTPCGSGDNTGVILQLGYLLDDGSFHELVEICQDPTKAVSHYAMHQVYGASVKGGVKSSERRSFSRGPKDVFPVVNPDKVYVRSGQIKAFDQILGSGGSDMYISSSSFLARGHLAPDADFIYNSGQLLTYWYANVAPQWQSFNAGNWLSIESTTRAIATHVWSTINVITGTHGVLQLANKAGVKKPIYLDATNNLLPAPELYWKVLQNPKTNACVVAIGVNNPFLTSAPTPICNTVTPNGWPDLTKDFKKGYSYYCDYASFKKVVDYVPELTCTSIFEFKK